MSKTVRWYSLTFRTAFLWSLGTHQVNLAPLEQRKKKDHNPRFRFLKYYHLGGDEFLYIHYLPELEWVFENEKSGDVRNRENSQTSSVWNICARFVEKWGEEFFRLQHIGKLFTNTKLILRSLPFL